MGVRQGDVFVYYLFILVMAELGQLDVIGKIPKHVQEVFVALEAVARPNGLIVMA